MQRVLLQVWAAAGPGACWPPPSSTWPRGESLLSARVLSCSVRAVWCVESCSLGMCALPLPACVPLVVANHCPCIKHPPLPCSLEICTFLLPAYFLPIGAVANAIKGLSWMAGGSTKSVFKVGCEAGWFSGLGAWLAGGQFTAWHACVGASVLHWSGWRLSTIGGFSEHTASCVLAWPPQVSFAADNNFGDVSAKATSQTICASVVGTSCGE